MYELGTLVEESRVIFIRFDTEVFATAQTCAFRKAKGYTTNQETRLQTGLIQDPGQHGGRRRFAMCSGNT